MRTVSPLNLISFRSLAELMASLRLTCSLYSWLIPCQCELTTCSDAEGSEQKGEYALNLAGLNAPQNRGGKVRQVGQGSKIFRTVWRWAGMPSEPGKLQEQSPKEWGNSGELRTVGLEHSVRRRGGSREPDGFQEELGTTQGLS